MRKATENYRTYLSQVKLQPWFLSLQWKAWLWTELQPWFLRLQWRTFLWAEHSDDDEYHGRNIRPNLLFLRHCVWIYYFYYLRPGADQSSKAAFCKSAFAKSKLTFGKSAFVPSTFAFRQCIFASQKAMVWPSATSKMFSAKTCQNMLESIFAFCSIDVRQSYL